jgi:hypothetical protein
LTRALGLNISSPLSERSVDIVSVPTKRGSANKLYLV